MVTEPWFHIATLKVRSFFAWGDRMVTEGGGVGGSGDDQLVRVLRPLHFELLGEVNEENNQRTLHVHTCEVLRHSKVTSQDLSPPSSMEDLRIHFSEKIRHSTYELT